MEGFTITNIGKVRSTNQDYSFCSCRSVGNLENLFIVADGMGGHNAGDYASSFTVHEVVSDIYSNTSDDNPVSIIKRAINNANGKLYDRSIHNSELSGTGTTLVVATVMEGILYVANIGDSRLYLFHNGLRQITKDHSLVNKLLEMGSITLDSPEYAKQKHVILRAVGTTPDVLIDFFEEKVRPGDLILMCSDGLTGMVDETVIESVLNDEGLSLEDKVRRLIELANDNGGVDNIAILLTEIS